jgi:hypothetical protein
VLKTAVTSAKEGLGEWWGMEARGVTQKGPLTHVGDPFSIILLVDLKFERIETSRFPVTYMMF